MVIIVSTNINGAILGYGDTKLTLVGNPLLSGTASPSTGQC
jgi:hypothetical protein